MGTGQGPSWFSSDFPALAAKRDPFPGVERWQTTYVRYNLSKTALIKGWDAESCRHNLHSAGLGEHPLSGHVNLPESINMRIIEAPAEFALPVKQDRRLLPCFKVRLEVKHRGAVSLPLTLRAHVLSEQDKEHVSSWVPMDDAAGGDDKGQKAVTELKGTAMIRCKFEAGGRLTASAGEFKKLGGGSKEDSGVAPASMGSGSTSPFTGSYAVRGDDASPRGVGASTGMPAARHEQPMLDPYHQGAPPFQSGVGRDVGCGAIRDGVSAHNAGLTTLFAANRPDPVVTLASSGRMSGTGSNLAGLGMDLGSGSVGGGGLATAQRDPFDASSAVEMLMQTPAHQEQQQQQRPMQQQQHVAPVSGAFDGASNLGGSVLLNDIQRQLQQRQMLQQQQQQQQLQDQRPQPSVQGQGAHGSGPNGNVGGDSGKMYTSTQDFEFTNLEFLKPTRMNKVYMAFTASIMDTDLLYVVFNVPTIGICRAEQREKACKKLNIDYRLLSHFDQGAERTTAVAAISALTRGTTVAPRDSAAAAAQEAISHMQNCKPPQPQPSPVAGQQAESRFAQAFGPAPTQLPMGVKFGHMPDAKPLQVPDTDYTRMQAAGLEFQQRMASASGPPGGGMSPAGMPNGSMALNGMQLGGMTAGGMLVHGMGTAGVAAPNGMAAGHGGAGGMPLNGMTNVSPALSGISHGGMSHSGMMHGGMGVGGLVNCGMGGGGLSGRGLPCGPGNSMQPQLGGPSMDFYYAAGNMQNGSMQNCGMQAGSMQHYGMQPATMQNCSMQGGAQQSYGSGVLMNGMGGNVLGGHTGMELGLAAMGGISRKRDQGPKEDDNYRFQPVQPAEIPPYQGFMGLTSSDVDLLLPAPHSRMAMRDFISEVYDSTGLHRKLTQMDIQALLSQAGFPMDSTREHDTISQQQWDEFCGQFRSIVGTLQQVTSVWNMEDPVVISGFDMDRACTVMALANEPIGTFICRFSMSQPGCLVLTCMVGTNHPRADPMGLIHAIIKIDDLHERRVDTWIRDYAGATHLLDVYRCKRVDKRKVFATNYTRLRGLEVDEPPPYGFM